MYEEAREKKSTGNMPWKLKPGFINRVLVAGNF